MAGDPSRQQRPDKSKGRNPGKGNAHGPARPGAKKPAPISQSDTKWVKEPGKKGYVVQISTGKRVTGKVAVVKAKSTDANKKGIATYAKGRNVTGAKKATPTRRPASSGSSGSTGSNPKPPPGRKVMGKASQYAEGKTAIGPNGKKVVVRNGRWTAVDKPKGPSAAEAARQQAAARAAAAKKASTDSKSRARKAESARYAAQVPLPVGTKGTTSVQPYSNASLAGAVKVPGKVIGTAGRTASNLQQAAAAAARAAARRAATGR